MRALRTSKTWLLLTLNALLILAGAPAFASQCCCVDAPAKSVAIQNDAPCHDEASPKNQAIVLNCCASETTNTPQISAAPHSSQFAHLQQVCSCPNPNVVTAVNDNVRCAHHSHLVATLPAPTAPQISATRHNFSVTTLLTPPAPIITRAAGRSPPSV